MRDSLPARPVLAALVLCGLIVVAAGADLAHTNARLPDAPSLNCESKAASCFNQELRGRLARQRAAEPKQSQYDTRAWLYCFALLAAAAIATAYSLRTRPRTGWPQIFTNLGVVGAWSAIGVTALLVLTSDAAVTLPAAPVYTVPVALLTAAAVGTLMSRSEGWADESQTVGAGHAGELLKLALHIGTAGALKRARLERLADWFALAALAFTAVTGLLAVAFVLSQPSCQANGTPPDWSDPIDAVTAVTAVTAIAAGVGGLVLRRWVPAVVALIVNPVAVFLILASTCAFD